MNKNDGNRIVKRELEYKVRRGILIGLAGAGFITMAIIFAGVL